MKIHGPLLAASCAAALTLVAQSAQAQGITVDQLGVSEAQFAALTQGSETRAISSPGVSFGSPVAFGAGWGTAGVGIGGSTQEQRPGSKAKDYDGSAGVVFGIGNPVKSIGLETTINVISLRSSFGDSGSANLKLHTALPGGMAFAVGVENVGRWGDAKATSSSVFAVGTKVLNASKMPVVLNVGVGDNRFNDGDSDGAGVFGSVAVLPTSYLSLIADYTGTALNAGVSVAPFRLIPLTVTLGATNVTGRNNTDPQFSGGLGYSFSF